MKARVLVTEVLGERALAMLAADPAVDLEAHHLLAAERYHERLAEAEAVIVRSAHRVDRADLAAAPRLRVVARAGAGVDNVDLAACTERGVLVLNTPGANAVSAAEHTWGLLLALVRHVRPADRHVREGGWDRSRFFGEELRDRRLGIIGIGRVGREVARFGRAFGMTVWAYDPYVAPEMFEALGVRRADTLAALLPHAQVLTVHTPKTGPRLGRAELAALPAGAYVLNVARGGLVDEEALCDLLEAGHLAGAALDVFEREPPPPQLRLLARDDVLVTCHLGGSTTEAQHRIGERVAASVLRALRGEVPEDAVNVPAPPAGTPAALAVRAGRTAGLLLAAGPSGPPSGLRAEATGAAAEDAVQLAGQALVAGVLERFGEEGVNVVNALVRARAHGLHLSVGRKAAAEPEDGDAARLVMGWVGDGGPDVALSLDPVRGELRLRRLWHATLDLDLSAAAALVATRHADRPGVVGHVGTLLGEAAVNIGHLQLARSSAGGTAVMALTADSLPGPDVVAALGRLAGVQQVAAVRLGGA